MDSMKSNKSDKGTSAQSLHSTIDIAHSGNVVTRPINPTGEADSTGKMMGPDGGVDFGIARTPMVAGIGQIPVDGKSSSLPGAQINGLTRDSIVDGKNMGPVGAGGSDRTFRETGSGMTYKYPGLDT